MEDQGRRLLLAVALAFGIMLLWQFLFPPEQPEKQPDAEDQATQTTQTTDPDRPDGPNADRPDKPVRSVELVGESGSDAVEDVAIAVKEPDNRCLADDETEPIAFDFPLFRAEFSRCGGTLASWKLKGDRFTKMQDGEWVPMDLVPKGDNVELRQFAVRFAEVDWDPHAYWTLMSRTDRQVSFNWQYKVTGADGTQRVAFELTKEYTLYPEDYLVEFSLQLVNKASKDERQTVIVSLHGYQDPDIDTSGGWTSLDTAWRSSCFINGEESRADVKKLANKGPKKRTSGDLKWGGFVHSYFLAVASPRDETDANHACHSYAITVDGQIGAMRTDIVFPVTSILVDGPWVEQSMVAYMGPKYLDKLEAVSQVVGYNPSFGSSIHFPWYAFLARPLLWLLQWFYGILGNWGLAIIFLTFGVKLATLYWATKSMRSMKAMAKLGPQIKALQAKHKDDKARLQQETMALYKTHNVNPLAGCLPIVLQMPIWISLYRMLMQAGEIYHAPFIPGWIDDLTGTDPYHILPIGLIIVMFVQAKLTPVTSSSAQQKVLQYGMPIMFGVFAFFFPAGLTLYIFTNTVLSALHHLYIRRTDKSGPPAKPANKGDADSESGTPRRAARSGTKKTTSGKTGVNKTSGRETASANAAHEGGRSREKARDPETHEGRSQASPSSSSKKPGGSAKKSRKGGSKRRGKRKHGGKS